MPQADTGLLNFDWSWRLIDGLAGSGVTHAVISPGSRSTPLTLACDHHPSIETHVLVDERSAGFFALGIARAVAQPVILIATSGSAPAHWLAAVIEAHHGGVPLILLSADRPPELHHTRANQTTEQQSLFIDFVRFRHSAGTPIADEAVLQSMVSLGRQAAQHATWPNPGPVHINLPFREPLQPQQPPVPPPPGKSHISTIAAPAAPSDPQVALFSNILGSGNGAILCGPMPQADDDTCDAILQLARHLSAPILADPLSGLRWTGLGGTHVISHYDHFLRQPKKWPQPGWLLRFGAPPVSKALQQWISQYQGQQMVCSPPGDWSGPAHTLDELTTAAAQPLCQTLLQATPRRTSNPVLDALQSLDTDCKARIASSNNLPLEAQLVREIMAQAAPNSILLASNSMPIRHFDSWSGAGDKPLRLIANRGISGIDGQISTLAGLATASDQRCIGLLGDLAFFHDMNGLQALRASDAILVLINNQGGGIFGYLPQRELDSYETYWNTPLGLNFEHAAALYQLQYHCCDNANQFSIALSKALQSGQPQIIEVQVQREESINLHQAFWRSL